MHLISGTVLQQGKYILQSVIGQGGFGITYKAFQSGLNREIAIKEFFIKSICKRDEGSFDVSLSSQNHSETWENFKKKFLTEARMIASLSHPNIVNIIDVFEENGTSYYAMEYITGNSLKNIVKQNGVYKEEDALNIISKTAKALDYIHSNNILHLDIKPDNIMMRDNDTPVIIDFGISKKYDESSPKDEYFQTGLSAGYSPPEQYGNPDPSDLNPATDIYSLSATLYFLLEGEKPPEAKTVSSAGVPLILDVSSETMGAIIKGMAPKNSERPRSISEFVKLLPSKKRAVKAVPDSKDIRELIDKLQKSKNYKAAYNLCLENINNGNDVEFSKAKAAELVDKLRKNNGRQSFWMIVLAIVVSITIFIISLSI